MYIYLAKQSSSKVSLLSIRIYHNLCYIRKRVAFGSFAIPRSLVTRQHILLFLFRYTKYVLVHDIVTKHSKHLKKKAIHLLFPKYLFERLFRRQLANLRVLIGGNVTSWANLCTLHQLGACSVVTCANKLNRPSARSRKARFGNTSNNLKNALQ